MILPQSRKRNVRLEGPTVWVHTLASFLLTQTDSLSHCSVVVQRHLRKTRPSSYSQSVTQVEPDLSHSIGGHKRHFQGGLFLCAHMMQRGHVLCPGQRSMFAYVPIPGPSFRTRIALPCLLGRKVYIDSSSSLLLLWPAGLLTLIF